MDITTLILTVISSVVGSGTIAGVVTLVVFRKQNKALKDQEVLTSKLENELKQTQVEQAKIANDKEQIDLGNMYLEKIKEISNLLVHNNSNRSDFEKKQTRRMDELTKKIDYCCTEIKCISDYLDGDYKNYKKDAGIVSKLKPTSKPKETKVKSIKIEKVVK